MSTNIRLTPTHILATQPSSIRGGPPQSKEMQLARVVEMLFPLAHIMLMPAGDGVHVEVAHVNNMNMSWRCAEHWVDVKAALTASGSAHVALTEPILRDPIAGAASQASPSQQQAKEAEHRRQLAERQKFPMPAKAGDLMRRPDATDVEPEGESNPNAGQAIAEGAAAGPGWDDLMPATSRPIQPGDLKIVKLKASDRGYLVWIAEKVENQVVWTRATVPATLLQIYPTWAEAADAIRVANLAHRLVDQEPEAA